MAKMNLREELRRFAESQVVKNISKQLNTYEKRVRQLVKDVDLKSRDARNKGRKQLDNFANQLQKTRREVEKKVRAVVNEEGHRLNQKVGELVDYLKSAAKSEKVAAKAKGLKKRVTKSVKTRAPKTAPEAKTTVPEQAGTSSVTTEEAPKESTPDLDS